MDKSAMSLYQLLICAGIAVFLAACAKDDISPVEAEKEAFDDLRTQLQEVIDDSGREQAAIEVVNTLQGDLAALRASIEKRKAKLQRLNADYDTTRSEFETFLAGVEAEVRENQRRVSETHRTLINVVTADELSAVAKAHTRAMNSAIASIQTI